MNVTISPYHEDYRLEIINLWAQVFNYPEPHNTPEICLQRKIDHSANLLLVAIKEENVVGVVMGGYDGHRGWIYSLAVDERHRGQKIGSSLLQEIEKALINEGAVKINLQLLGSNKKSSKFYKELGYTIEDRVSMGKRLINAG